MKIRLFKGFSSAIAIVLSLLLPAIAARADQCVLVPKQQALAAITRLEPGQTIYNLCELCGETKPNQIVINTIVLMNDPTTKLWEIKINDREIDLAYTYIDYKRRSTSDRIKKTNSRINLSIIANCPADGFTPIIYIK